MKRGRPPEPYRDEVAWAIVEFYRDRQGLERDSVRGACQRLERELMTYIAQSPSASHLKNLHTAASAKAAVDDSFRQECEGLLARLRRERDEQGCGRTIPEYLHMRIPQQ